MCLSPIRIKNNSIYLNVASPTRLLIDVPCGKCADCQMRYKMDWFVRIYMQMLHIIFNGGYVLYDTLTYNNSSLPTLSKMCIHLSSQIDLSSIGSISCFRRADIAPFFKRLRSRIDYYCLKRKLPVPEMKYIIFSEYGTDERYTHRPHYHLFIYLSNKSVPPRLLSVYVSKCWPFGRTDGVMYNSWSYVKRHIYDDSYSPDVLYKVCNYVSKYVLKDVSYSTEVSKRFDKIILELTLHKFSIEDIESIMAGLKLQVGQFHLQSKGLGFDYIESMSDDKIKQIIRSGTIELPYSTNGSASSSYYLPHYIRRRLFYDCVVDNRTSVRRYIPNDNYYLSLRSSLIKQIDAMCLQYSDIYSHVLSDSEREFVDTLLNGRNIKDFVLYVVFQRGRCFRFDSDGVIIPWPTDLDDFAQQLRKIYRFDYISTYYRLVDDDLSTDNSVVLFKDSYFKNITSVNKDLFTDSKDINLPTFLDKIVDNHVLKSDFIADFVSFDFLFDFFSKCKSVKENCEKKQRTYQYLQDLDSRLG